MTVLRDWKYALSVDDILRGEGADPESIRKRKPQLVLEAERALNDGMCLIHPIALTCEIAIRSHHHGRIFLENGTTLTGSLVTQHLAGARRVVAAVCTIGAKLEKEVTRLLGEDPLFAMALDGLGNAAVDMLAQQVCAKIGYQVQAEDLQASTPLSPGSPEWPVETGQPQIFSLLDPSQAGITLTSGGMMLPKKSMSFIVGLGLEMSQAEKCDLCSLKATCRYGYA